MKRLALLAAALVLFPLFGLAILLREWGRALWFYATTPMARIERQRGRPWR